MTYKLIRDNDKFVVIEIASDKRIHENTDHDKAHDFYRHLKGGGGFDGWTPDFFTGHNLEFAAAFYNSVNDSDLDLDF